MRLDVGLQEFLGVHVDRDKNGVGFCCNEVRDGNILGVTHDSTLRNVDGHKTTYQFAESNVELMLLGFDV